MTNGGGSGIHGNVRGSGSNTVPVPKNAEGTSDTCRSAPPCVPIDIPEPVDWPT